MQYITIYKNPFQEKPNQTLTRSASSDYVNYIGDWRCASVCSKTACCSERRLYCSFYSASTGIALLALTSRSRNHDNFTRCK